MSKKVKTTIELFFTFLKIGAFTFGGGYAMIALLQNEFVAKKKWLSPDEFLDIVSISESTPGPIAVNTATFIGYKKAGFQGALFSTLGVCMPSFFVIFLISLIFEKFLEFEYVGFAFKGIGACVVYLIFSAGIKMLKGLKATLFSKIIFCVSLIAFVAFSLFAIKFSTIYFILISGIAGIFVYLFSAVKGGKKEK